MSNISTKVKKLNIFQKIRLNYALRQTNNPNFTIEDYLKKPDYIKSNHSMLYRIIEHSNIDIEDIRQVVPPELVCSCPSLKIDYNFIKGYPIKTINELLKNKILSPNIYQEKDKYELLQELIEAGFPDTLKENNWGYMPEIDDMIYTRLMQNNKIDAAHSILTYFEPELLLKYVYDNPEVIQYLTENQQQEYEKKLEKIVEKMIYTEDKYDYVSTRPIAFKYLKNEDKPEILKLCFANKIDMWPAVSENNEDATLYMNEIERLIKTDQNEIIRENAKFMPICEVAKMLSRRNLSYKQDIILNNLTEEQLAEWFDTQKDKIRPYEQEYNLDKILSKYNKYNCIDYLSEDKRNFLIQKFQSLSVSEQIKYAQTNAHLIKYIPPEEQAKLIKEMQDPKNITYCSLSGKKNYIKNNPADFIKIDDKSKVQLVAEDIRLFDYLSPVIQSKVKNDLTIPEHAKIFGKFLKEDINSSKNFRYEGIELYEGIDNALKELFNNHQSLDDETIVDFVLRSKLFSAVGKLTESKDILHGNIANEEIYGIDEYTQGQLTTIQSVRLSAVAKLVKIDTNYVLPYLADSKNTKYSKMSQEERIFSEERAKELFIELYGDKKYDEYKECFKTIYDLEEEYTQTDSRNKFQRGYDDIHDFNAYEYHMNVPLEEFKILFNTQIIEKCDSALIKEYFQSISNHEEIKPIFEKIIETAYGERAANIIKSRPQLDVHSINSLECLDERILNSYGEAFVHDTISYNIRNFSEFLEIAKDSEKNSLFKNYYKILSNVFGNNVETMQKAITEFSYVHGLLENIKNVDLSEDQALNLVNVLCSEKNPYDVQTLEQIYKYNEIANQELQEIVINRENIGLGYIKEKLCQNLFGIHFFESSSRGYGTSLEVLEKLYDMSERKTSKGEYSIEEKKLLNIMNYINEEDEKEKLTSLVKNIGDLSNLRNYFSINKLIDKIQERELSEMNSHITTTEKLDEICIAQANESNPSVYKEEIDDVPIYHLNGEPFCLFSHNPGNISMNDILSYEGQGGNSAICTRFTTEKLGSINGKLLYGKILNQGLITVSNGDANTQHVAKRTKMTAVDYQGVSKLTEFENTNAYGNEVTMYRRQREHSRITNDNSGGRIIPMAYGVCEADADLSKIAAKLKGTGIAIFYMHSKAYQEKEKNEERRNDTTVKKEDEMCM